ncbi:MAG: hypothetical protein ACOX3T_06875 [Bdellovibrionota bacterium]
MKRKFLLFTVLLLIILLVFIKLFAGNFALLGIKELNKTSNINVLPQKVKFSFPVSLNFNKVSIFNKRKPFLNVELDTLKTYLSLKGLLTLVIDVKSKGTLYDGNAKFDIWKNFRSEDIRADLFLENVNISKHSFLKNFPISGGFLNLRAFNFLFDKKFNIVYLGGDFNLSRLSFDSAFKIPALLSGLPLDVEVPEISISNISSVYKLKEKDLYLNNFKFESDLINAESKNCEYNFKSNNFSKCIIKFNFTDKGLKNFSSLLSLLAGGRIKDTSQYAIELEKKNVKFLSSLTF